MRLNKDKFQRLTFIGKSFNSPNHSSNDNTLCYTQKLGWMSKPSTRHTSIEKKPKSRDKIVREKQPVVKKENK